jgi:iron complex outermembrane receptor protein
MRAAFGSRPAFSAALLVAFSPIAASASAEDGTRALTELSLEELSNIEVTSVSKKEEPLADAAAAIAVISSETLRRSGATTIPEALRLVPGLHIAQATSNVWAVNARGFSSGNSAKLLVLSDTRSIYTPFFSGVFWDVQDFVLEDIDRVEVIRGPGASLWGANAVNGVINITTRSAKETQGAYFEGGGGTLERGFGAVRYGGKLGEGLYFRVFAQGFDRSALFNPDGPRDDNWKLGHFGFRADGEISAKDKLTLQADAYAGDIGQISPSVRVGSRPGPAGKLVAGVAGGNVLARWTRTFESGSDVELRVYYDGTHRDDPTFVDNLDTLDADLQHRIQLPLRQELVWGLNYRWMNNRNRGKGLLALNPPDAQDSVISGFVQDQIAVLDSLKLTLGSKLEHNDFSGVEIQPTARIAWNPFHGHVLWGSASRAVRVPTRIERDVDVTVTNPGQTPVIKLLGNRDYGSELLFAYELGYRWQVKQALFVDLAAYYNIYHRLDSLEFNPPFADPQTGQTIVPIVNKNLTDGVSRGVEASLTFTPARSWRLVANYSYILITIHPNGQDLNGGYTFAGLTPRNQVALQSFLDLPSHFQLDAFFRYADSLRATKDFGPGQYVPDYASLDLRLSWQGWKGLDFSLVGQNLLQDHHREFPGGSEVERTFYAKVAGRF